MLRLGRPADLVVGGSADLLDALPWSGPKGSWAGFGSGRGGGVSDPVSLKLATVARDPAWGRPGDSPADVVNEHALLRLALWLADVAAETTLAATAPAAAAARRTGRADESPIAEPAP